MVVRRRFAAAAVAAGLASAALLFSGGVAQVASAQSTSTGLVKGFGDATALGAPDAAQLAAPIAGIATTPDGKGYWLLGADGGVFTFGDAHFYGSPAQTSPGLATGIAATPDGGGYWVANASSGFAQNFGDAADLSVGGATVFPDAPVVGIAATVKGMGYWLVGADGGVFTYGNAAFHGSAGNLTLNSPIVGMAATPDGGGYWLVAADGGVFSYGDARFFGSLGAVHLNSPIVGMASTRDGRGYWLVAADGGVFSFGDAGFFGSLGATPPPSNAPAVGIAPSSDGKGYLLATTGRALAPSGPVPSLLTQCELPGSPPTVRPSFVELACGDGNAFLQDLSWSTWTATGASGSGTFTHNTCTPDCADGTFVSVPATVTLAYPTQTSAGLEFASVRYTFPDPTAPGGVSTQTQLLLTLS